MVRAHRHSAIRDVVIIATIVGGMFLAIEGAVRVFLPQTLVTDYVGGSSIAIPDDELGFRLRPGARAVVRGPEFAAEYRHNRKGLRDEAEHRLPKPEGSTRILVLGDSFAYGASNAYEQSWPTLVERRLLTGGHPVEVVKAGVPGYDTRGEALYLERIFADYQPDIVLLTFMPNDLFTNVPIGARVEELDENAPVQARLGKDSSLHSLILLKRLLMAHDRLYARLYMLTRRLEYFTTPPSPTLQRQIEVTKALLDRIQGFCRQTGSELIVLSIPQQFQVIAPESAQAFGVHVDAIDREFGAFAAEREFAWEVTLPTLREVYRSEEEDLFYRFDGHLNEHGNRAVAAYLAAVLAERLPAPPAPPPPTAEGAV
jgi:lysophospholipase L1-like esterase